MNFNKLFCLLLAVILFGSILTSCGDSKKQPVKTTDPPKESEKGEEPIEKSADREVITVSMNVMEAEKCGNNPKSDYVLEKFGIKFDYIPVSWGDWNEKITTWISTGDTPDLIWWDLKGTQSNQYRTWANQGAFSPIPTDMLSKYPNLKKNVDSMESFKALEVDGKLYAWPSSRNNPPEVKNTYGSVFTYRRDWARAVGLYKEKDIYTWDEWKTLVKAVIDQDPGENGIGQTAGIVMPTWAFPHAAVLFIGSVPAEGNETCSYIKLDDEWVWPPMLDSYKDEVEETWKLYQDGLIWKDNMQFKGNEDEELFKAGRAFARYSTGIGTINSFQDELIKNDLTKDKEAVGPVIIKDRNGDAWMTQTEDYWTVTAFSSKVDEAKMERVLELWDFLNSDEGILFQQLGFEGQDYKLNGEQIEVLWEKDDKTGNYTNPYSEMRFGEFTPACLTPAPSPVDAEYGVRQWEDLYTSLNEINFKVKPFNYEMSFFSAPNKDKYGNFGSDVKAKMQELIANAKADPAAEWDAFIQSMMPRVQPILDELNQGIK